MISMNTSAAPIPLDESHGWQARLALEFESRDRRTVLASRKHHGPLVVQRPFYPEHAVCHTYLVHPPGGVVGGDHLSLTAAVGENAHALITTPASGKFYRSDGRCARLQQHLQVDKDATLEWLPQDTILFAGCKTDMVTRIDLAAGSSTFIGWEILCLGRPSSGEDFDHGHCRQRFELWREDQPLVIDRSRFAGGDDLLSASWGLQSHQVTATLLATPCTREVLEAVREKITEPWFSASLVEDVLVCRYLGSQGAKAREIFGQAWSVIRPMITGKSACPPRVWAT